MKRVILLQLLLLASVAAAATDANLVGWWKFDDGNGTTASDSASSKNGAVYGATWATGQVGGALSFDGANDSVELPINNPAWLPQNDFTVSTWAYFYGDPLSDLHDFLLDLDFSYWTNHARCSGYALFRAAGNGKAVFQIETTATTDAVGSNVTLTKNRWYHIAGVRHGTTLEIYLDGQLNAASVCSADPIKFSGGCINYRAIIGKMGDECGMPAAYFLNGMVDDVRIYNRALSADDIQQLAHPATTDPNLVGWWKLDDGTGTVAYDSAGSNNGNLINGPVWISGYIDGGLSFDGVNDYVDVPDNAALRFTKSDSFSICSWVNPTSGWGEILGKMQSGGPYGLFTYEVQWNSTSQNFDVLLCNSGNYYKYFVTPTDSAPAGIWSHIACVYQNKNVMIYINGELKVSDYFNSDPGGAANNNLAIGVRAYNGVKERYFNGTLDDVRIYNKALSAEEVQQLYKGTTPILTGLEITGPDEVAEETTASYKAIAHYDNGTTKDVTALAEWRAEPNIVATVEAGQLTTGQVLYPKQKIRVYAEYTENEIDVNAQKQVSVFAICPQGNALMFDGLNDYVELGSPANLDNLPLRDLTISAWIYDRHIAGYTWGTIFGTYMSPNGWTFRTISDTAGKRSLYFQVPFMGSSENYWATYQSSNGTILKNTWHYVVAVWNSSTKTAKLYIDGAEPSYQITHPGVGIYNSDASNNKEVGRIPHAGGIQCFNGMIDDVRIYNRALSAEEIGTVMYGKPTGSDPNLVAYWDFDEGAGQTAADVSGRGNNGVLGSSTGIDTADPCWVESDAPNLCTTEQVMLRNLLGATDNKKIANQLIADAKAKERASIQLITDLQKQMNGKERMNAIKAKAQIFVAITQEEIASRQIEATIKRLEDALRLLNYEVDPNSEPPLPRPWGWQWHFNNKPGGKK